MNKYEAERDALKAQVAALQAEIDLRNNYERVSQRMAEWARHARAKRLGSDKYDRAEAQQVKAAIESLTTCYTDTPPRLGKVHIAIEAAENAITMLEEYYKNDIAYEREKEQQRSDSGYKISLIGDCIKSTLPLYTYK